jgi:Predicted oxidoreductases (related to aryl-alcohol dehydrogenases)
LPVKGIANEHNATISQIAAAWVLAKEGMSSAIIGTQNANHFIENIDAINLALTGEDIKN